MKAKSSDWYKHGWTLDIQDMSWVEDTENQVNFIIKTLGLTGKERILDLACGFGRHSLSFAQKGYSVVGVDITKDYIDYATKTAKETKLPVTFIQSDIRDIGFEDEFDVVLNLADGAIGYLETEENNHEIFAVISLVLKQGGKHFMDICNAEHAEHYFPKTNWDIGEKSLSLAQFDWDKATRRMIYGSCSIPFGLPAQKPNIAYGCPIRLYSLNEVTSIFEKNSMNVVDTFSDYSGNKNGHKELQLMVYSIKI